jgi:hypothetical protein
MGGLWGREGVHPGERPKAEPSAYQPNVVLTVQEYRGFQPKSQYITLTNAYIIA